MASGVTIVPVVRTSINRWKSPSGLSFFVSKEPIAIAVVSASAKQAFRISGQEITPGELIEEVPSIKGILEKL